MESLTQSWYTPLGVVEAAKSLTQNFEITSDTTPKHSGPTDMNSCLNIKLDSGQVDVQ